MMLGTNGNQKAKYIPLIFSTAGDACSTRRPTTPSGRSLPGADGRPSTVLTRVAVATAITNGNFSGSLAGWTNADEAGASSIWNAGAMVLLGTGFNRAIEYQAVTVASGDFNKEHALRIVVLRGTITLNIGVSVGSGEYAFNLALGAGTHSIAFAPSGSFNVQITNAIDTAAYVASVNVEGPGPLVLPTTWALADLPNLRWDASGDVTYVASLGKAQQKIIRWGQAGETGYHSYSVAAYLPQGF